MIKNKDEITNALKKFKHKTNGYVKFHEVDHFNVVHNLKYLEWAEVARVEYCRDIGISILPNMNTNNEKSINEKSTNDLNKIPNNNSNPTTDNSYSAIYMVHSEVNYFHAATFFDKYIVYTRVNNIGRSSVTFEHIITKENGTPLCTCETVEVYTDKTNTPTDIPPYIREKISNFENITQ